MRVVSNVAPAGGRLVIKDSSGSEGLDKVKVVG